MRPVVVKVGGSLYDWPELGPRLRRLVASLAPSPVLLVPGGGELADAIRRVYRTHAMTEEAAHWLALRSLTAAAHVLAELLPAPVMATVHSHHRFAILDPHQFALADEQRPDHLPHTWNATSDSIAARVAVIAGASRLILLKSADPPRDWMHAPGYVDPVFANIVAEAPFAIEAINLRADTTTRMLILDSASEE